MRILFVCNNAYIPGNGISTSVRNTVSHLREIGQDVRIMSSENPSDGGPQPEYKLKRYHFPIFQPIIDANGFCYAERDYDLIRKAVAWADVVHIEEPFFLQKSAIKEAKRQGKAVTGSFHLYTQNLLTEIPFASFGLSNRILMYFWRRNYFDRCSDVHCPTPTVKNLLEQNGFKSRLHVISNGVRIEKESVLAREPQTDPYLILSVGRFTTIKNQVLLIEAMKYSRHAGQIQLYFAGKGQMEQKQRKMAEALMKAGILKHRPVFAFHNAQELKDLASRAYLYVHTAKIEVEGLGCVESIREGTVPLIASGPLVATTDFALDERSIFPLGDAKTLAEKIDWWIEHPEERNQMAQKYADSSRKYDANISAQKLVKMFEMAVADKR